MAKRVKATSAAATPMPPPPLLRFLLWDVPTAFERLADLLLWSDALVVALVSRQTRASALYEQLVARRVRVRVDRDTLPVASVRECVTAVRVDEICQVAPARAFYTHATRLTLSATQLSAGLRAEPLETGAGFALALAGVTQLQLDGWALGSLSSLTTVHSLVELELCGPCHLTDACVASLASLTQLRSLRFEDVSLSAGEAFPQELHHLRSLSLINVRGYYVDMDDFAGLHQLITLTLQDMRMKPAPCNPFNYTPFGRPLPSSLTRVCVSCYAPSPWFVEHVGYLLRGATRLEALVFSSHWPGHTQWAAFRFPYYPPTALHVNPAHGKTLTQLDLTDFCFNDISMLEACTQLHTLRVSLCDEAAVPGAAVVLRALPRLRTLSCRNLHLADFVDALPRLEDLSVWLRSTAWPEATHACMQELGGSSPASPSVDQIPPTVEMLALRRLRRLSFCFHCDITCPVVSWATVVARECVQLTHFTVIVARPGVAETFPQCLELSALDRLEELSLTGFGVGVASFLPLRRLCVLRLHAWPPETDLAPLYRVGLPSLRCLVMGDAMDCLPLKTYDRLDETLPLLTVIWHLGGNCRWTTHARCPRESG